VARKQVKFYIEPELYEKLKRIAEEQGTSVPQLVRGLVLDFLGEAGDGNLAGRLSELEAKYEQLARELGRVEKDLAMILKRCCRGERSR
jgi:predicted DNA-binding ribbon-helix-helix protein